MKNKKKNQEEANRRKQQFIYHKMCERIIKIQMSQTNSC